MTLFSDLVATSQRVAGKSARLAKIRELSEFLTTLAVDEIEIAVHYLSGETPQGRIGLTYKSLHAAMLSPSAEKGLLSITDVDRCLDALAGIRGAGSAALRSKTLTDMFSRATSAEQEFLVRLIVGELRQGALAGVMIDAIATASNVPIGTVRRAAMYSNNLGAVARIALREGAEPLALFQLEPFAPASPMLAQTAGDVEEALQELGDDVVFEWKMDGARIQVHKVDDQVRIYTRASNEVTAAVPEIADAARALPAPTLVLDGEAIAFDADGRPYPFQITMRRFGRKLNVEAMQVELPIKAFYFDCLHADGHSTADRPLHERFQSLAAAVPPDMRVPRLVTSDESAASAFYDAAIAAGHEGLMAKSQDAPYEAGNRGASWLKIKRAHSLDLVVLAAEWGHGRRKGRLSNLHLGALEPRSGEYIMLGKTFKGLTDAILEWQTGALLARETRRDAHTVYVRPELVVEIAFSDLQASTRYPGGFALRLARVKRYRDDRRPEDADTMDSIRRINAVQAGQVPALR